MKVAITTDSIYIKKIKITLNNFRPKHLTI